MMYLALLVHFIAQSPPPCTARATAPALDHAVIVVSDLDAASAELARLGFKLKAGRLHSNNLLNRHIKFRDSSSIELMTVRGLPSDEMARDYADLLQHGEGGVYVALTIRSISEVQRAAATLSLETRHSQSGPWQFISFAPSSGAAAVFFSDGTFGVQDPDSVLSHTAGVRGLSEVWVEGNDQLSALLSELGAGRCETVRAHDGRMGQRWALNRGSIVVVPSRPNTRPRVLGAALTVTASSPARRFPLPDFWIQYERK